MRSNYYNNETLCQMKVMFERSCADLGIQEDSAYAQSAREVLAHILFALPNADETQTAQATKDAAKTIQKLLNTTHSCASAPR